MNLTQESRPIISWMMNNPAIYVMYILLIFSEMLIANEVESNLQNERSNREKDEFSMHNISDQKNALDNAYKEFNVKYFGAKGDGKTDDTKSIQNALDSAAIVKANVFFPDGIYLCSTLYIHDYVGMLSLIHI